MQVSINGGEENMTSLEERFAAMVDLAKNPEDAKAREIVESNASDEMPNPIYTDNYQERYMYGGAGFGIRMYDLHESEDEDDDYREEEKQEEIDQEDALAAMIDQISNSKKQVNEDYERRSNEQINEYLQRKKNENNATAPVEEPSESEEEETAVEEPDVNEDGTEHLDESIEEEKLKELHESTLSEDKVEEEAELPTNPEDAAVLVNGKPLPIGEEVIV